MIVLAPYCVDNYHHLREKYEEWSTKTEAERKHILNTILHLKPAAKDHHVAILTPRTSTS